MSKDYTLDTISNISGKIIFNYYDVDISQYYIMRIEFHGTGLNGEASCKGEEGLNVGTAESDKFTDKEIYTKIDNVLGSAVSGKFKDLYLNLIAVDLTI